MKVLYTAPNGARLIERTDHWDEAEFYAMQCPRVIARSPLPSASQSPEPPQQEEESSPPSQPS